MFDIPLRSAGHLPFGDEHEIQGRRTGGALVAAEALPQQPLRAVAHHRSTQLAAGRQAEAVNARGTAHVAEAARDVGARLLHVSTDFVFDGASGRPYAPDDLPQPLGVYGRTKLANVLFTKALWPTAKLE
jgi:dTDP-4-dehydrorhamnose reductase